MYQTKPKQYNTMHIVWSNEQRLDKKLHNSEKHLHKALSCFSALMMCLQQYLDKASEQTQLFFIWHITEVLRNLFL